MASIMDNAEELVQSSFDTTIEKYLFDYIHSEKFINHIELLTHQQIMYKFDYLHSRVVALESELEVLRAMVKDIKYDRSQVVYIKRESPDVFLTKPLV